MPAADTVGGFASAVPNLEMASLGGRETKDTAKTTMMGSSGGSPPSEDASGGGGSVGVVGGGGGNKALIHPQRHNLKNRFELLKTLGEGTYGKVKLACVKATGEEVAIKYVKKTKIQDENDLNRIRREIRILTCLQHPNIVNIRQVFEKKDRIVLVMDYAQGGELYDYLNSQRCLPEPETRRIFRQIAAAVHYVHESGIVHRDLKLENIILDSKGNVKIADFGLANYFSKDSALNTYCGSPLYASPEIVNGRPYQGPEVDVWSLGVVLYTLAYGAMPFESGNVKVLRQQISSGHYAEPAKPCGASGLIRHMMTVNSARRATMLEVLNHWWVNLGYEETPDGRKHDLMSLPLGRASHRQLGAELPSSDPSSSSSSSSSSAPASLLHRVPGARNARKAAALETSIDEDDVLCEAGTSASALRSSSHGVVSAGAEGGSALRGVIDDVVGGGDGCGDIPGGEVTQDDQGNVPWSQVLANSIREIRDRVIQSLANEDASEGEQTVRPDASAPVVDGGDSAFYGSGETAPSQDGHVSSSSSSNGADGDKTATVFDSDRKPKRGILKRKGKFSGGDSCSCMDDAGGFRSEDGEGPPSSKEQFPDHPHNQPPDVWEGNPTMSSVPSEVKMPTTSSSALPLPTQGDTCPSQHCHSNPTASTMLDRVSVENPLEPHSAHSHHYPHSPTDPNHPSPSQVPAETEGSQNRPLPSSQHCPSLLPSSSTITSSGDSSSGTSTGEVNKVVRRRKGILKNAGGGGSNRNSLIDDARKRLSMGSQSSNSSADILDLSYDSVEGEQLVCRSRSLDLNQAICRSCSSEHRGVRSRSLSSDHPPDMICRSRSSENPDMMRMCRSQSVSQEDMICGSLSAGEDDRVSRSRSSDSDDLVMSRPQSTDGQEEEEDAAVSDSRCAGDSSEGISPLCKSRSTDTTEVLHSPQNLPDSSQHVIRKSQSVGEDAVRRFRSCDLQQALSELSMSFTKPGRRQYESYGLEAEDAGSFSLEGEFTAVHMADVSSGLVPRGAPPPLCEDALFDYSEARHVLKQALQFAN